MRNTRGLGERLCKDCQARNKYLLRTLSINRDDAIDHSRYKKLIKDG